MEDSKSNYSAIADRVNGISQFMETLIKCEPSSLVSEDGDFRWAIKKGKETLPMLKNIENILRDLD